MDFHIQRPRKLSEAGFSLTELLVVVSVLLLAAAVIFPRVTHSRLAADEAAAMQAMRQVHSAQAQYASVHPDTGFSGTLGDLLAAPVSLDPNLAAGQKGGYLFLYVPGERVNGAIRTYTLTADPEKVGESGQRRFFTDESGEVRYNASGPAGATSPVIQ